MSELRKVCPGCRRHLLIEAFGIKTRWPNGDVRQRYGRCKRCNSEYRREHSRHRTHTRPLMAPVDREVREYLPIQPLRDWLEQQLQDPDTPPFILAARLGIDDRRLHHWRYDAMKVPLDKIDKAFCTAFQPHLLGELWPALYQFDNEEHAA